MPKSSVEESAYLDIADPSFSLRSEEVREARARNWYARTSYGLAVLRYEEAGQLLRDPRLRQGSYAWPRHNGVTTGPFAEWWDGILMNKEGEDHKRLRKLANAAFTPRIIKALRPRFEDLANELVDGFVDRGACEFMSEFSEPYATRVICMLLGIPESEWRQVAAWSGDIGLALGVTFGQEIASINQAMLDLFDYSRQLIAERRCAPGDDFLTTLVQAEVEGERLSEQELLYMVPLLIFGGIDTTRNQLGLALHLMIDYPEQWELLAEQPELAAAAVEEVMRVRPAATWVTREAVEDLEFQGLAITKGTTVHLLSESAGTDPRAVPDGHFDISAKRPQHYGFGMGIHHCIGHFLARTDISVVLQVLPHRMTNLRLTKDVIWLPDSGNTGPVSLSVGFDQRGRLTGK